MMTASAASASTPDSFSIWNISGTDTPSALYVGDTYDLQLVTDARSQTIPFVTDLLVDGGSIRRPLPIITFTDNGSCVGRIEIPSNIGEGGGNHIWTPTTAGQHTLTATEDVRKTIETIIVTVLPRTDGTTPPPPPQPAPSTVSCTSTGSGNSGS